MQNNENKIWWTQEKQKESTKILLTNQKRKKENMTFERDDENKALLWRHKTSFYKILKIKKGADELNYDNTIQDVVWKDTFSNPRGHRSRGWGFFQYKVGVDYRTRVLAVTWLTLLGSCRNEIKNCIYSYQKITQLVFWLLMKIN